MKQELIDFKQYYQSVATKIPAQSFYFEANIHKYRHSIDVLRIGCQLLETTPELSDVNDDFKIQARRALLFHDVGRFKENFQRYFAEQNNRTIAATSNEYDHGLIGYELLRNTPPYNDLRILFAIRYHGKMMETVQSSEMWHSIEKLPQQDEIKKILYLVRDADKLANLEVQKATGHLRKDNFYKQLAPQDITGPLSRAAKEQFFAAQTLEYKNIKTYADRVLMVLSWIFDFNYIRTEQLFFECEYDAYLLNELTTCDVSSKEIKQIRNILAAFQTCL